MLKKITLALLFFVTLSYAADLRDPTRPSAYAGNEEATTIAMSQDSLMVLNGLLLSPGRRVAVINGIALQIGELENGVQLLSIDEQKQSVQVMKDQQKIELTFPVPSQADIEIKDKP